MPTSASIDTCSNIYTIIAVIEHVPMEIQALMTLRPMATHLEPRLWGGERGQQQVHSAVERQRVEPPAVLVHGAGGVGGVRHLERDGCCCRLLGRRRARACQQDEVGHQRQREQRGQREPAAAPATLPRALEASLQRCRCGVVCVQAVDRLRLARGDTITHSLYTETIDCHSLGIHRVICRDERVAGPGAIDFTSDGPA